MNPHILRVHLITRKYTTQNLWKKILFIIINIKTEFFSPELTLRRPLECYSCVRQLAEARDYCLWSLKLEVDD